MVECCRRIRGYLHKGMFFHGLTPMAICFHRFAVKAGVIAKLYYYKKHLPNTYLKPNIMLECCRRIRGYLRKGMFFHGLTPMAICFHRFAVKAGVIAKLYYYKKHLPNTYLKPNVMLECCRRIRGYLRKGMFFHGLTPMENNIMGCKTLSLEIKIRVLNHEVVKAYMCPQPRSSESIYVSSTTKW